MHVIKEILSKYMVPRGRGLASDSECNINSSLGLKSIIFVFFSCFNLGEHIHGNVICRHCYF